ncbi:MAG: thioredoxin family protein [Bacteroidales bacterium]|nr:thioredoxin family protein [Bacteroidales bacterium]
MKKKLTKIIILSVVLLIVALILLAFLHKQKSKDISQFQGLYLHDSIEVFSQINNENKILMVFFNPECEMCQSEIKSLDNFEAKDVVLDLISSAHSDSVAKFVKDYHFKNFKSYSVTVDSLSKWSIALDINYIPTLIYVKNREIQKRRTGVVKLETIINEKEGN